MALGMGARALSPCGRTFIQDFGVPGKRQIGYFRSRGTSLRSNLERNALPNKASLAGLTAPPNGSWASHLPTVKHQRFFTESEKSMRRFFAGVLVASALATASVAQEDSKIDARIDAAHAVLHELMNTPDRGIPLDIAARATCVLVVPSFKKGAFVFGGEYGQGVATCRTRRGSWSAPAFVQLEGASFGFQIGGQSTDLVLIGMNHHAIDDLLKDKVKLGGDIAVAAGPVGRNSQAATTELANAEFLTYSRSRGLFAGIDLNGDVVHQNTSDTEKVYGQNIPYAKILGGGVATPPAAAHFIVTVNQLFRRGVAHRAGDK
jgi:SH3 domain-containing YSC84-like protein 1